MTTYNDKFNKDTNKVFVILVILSFVFIFARLSQPVSSVRTLIYHFIIPGINITSHSFSSSNRILSNISGFFTINDENTKFKEELVLLTEQLRDYQSVYNENIQLKNLLNLPVPVKTKLLFANIIARDPSQWYKWIIINKGLKDGITKDMPAVTVMSNNEICILGKTIDVYESSSKIALITNSLFAVPVQIKNSQTDCLLEGADSQYLKLTHVPNSVQLNINDEIVTSPLSSVFTKDIPVGKITEITKTPYDDYSEILVQPYMQDQRIYEVAVIMRKEELQ